MKLKEILSDSFHYPFSNPKRLLLLGILTAASILIIPAILVMGYTLRIMEYSFNGSSELPPFNEWLVMFVDGLKYIIVMVVYIGIPAFVTGFLTIFIIILIRAYGVIGDFYTFFITFLLSLLVVGISIIGIPYIFGLMALPHIVKKNKLEVLLDFKNIFAIIKKIGWIKYLTGVVILTILNLLVVALNIILQLLNMNQLTIYAVSAVIGLFIGSYLAAFRGRLLVLLYQEGIEEE